MPDLTNYEQSLASGRLEGLGLAIGKIQNVDSMSVDQGKVVSTEPKAGEKVAEGSAIKLNISTGRVEVPEVIGMSESQAVEAFAKVGLRADAQSSYSDRKSGTVIDQAYPKGTKVPVGDVIRISIARPRPAPTTVTTTATVTQTAPPGTTPTDGQTTPTDGETPPQTPPEDPAQTG
ncbi:PASTA domain-containing protein [Mobilicoccus caccae]|uniref:PASTA domain-containing protein n=1 Tax=Mobilicoccus caccae TaxID=1859295 RepID=UPI0024E087F3|nr:PASTA domain-containing protein [Mobilicoccus caccae]